jgi:hypothetical protein
MIKISRAVVLLLLLASLPIQSRGSRVARRPRVGSPTRPASARTRGTAHAPQKKEEVDISDTYKGRIYYSDITGDRYVMKGPVTVEIKKRDVTLTPAGGGKPLKGKIKTEQLPDQGNFPVGEIHFENDTPIEIRWYRSGKWLRIVRATNEANKTRVFRFCSNLVKSADCKDKP